MVGRWAVPLVEVGIKEENGEIAVNISLEPVYSAPERIRRPLLESQL